MFAIIPDQDMIKNNCKTSIFKKFLLKLTRVYVFPVNNRIIKQISGCPMGGPISLVFPDIYVSKMEEDIIASMKKHFYPGYVDEKQTG